MHALVDWSSAATVTGGVVGEVANKVHVLLLFLAMLTENKDCLASSKL